MRVLLLAAALAVFPAYADLYRWVDRESGSVKFSTTPPPWYGDPDKERFAPAVEVLRYRDPAPPKPAEDPVRAKLQAAWRKSLQDLLAVAERPDIDRAIPQLQDALRSAEARNAELDRLDPGGAETRRRETQAALDRVRDRLQASR